MIEDCDFQVLSRELRRLESRRHQLLPFADQTMEFISVVSERLRRLSRTSEYRADLVALAHWLRSANLRRLKERLARTEEFETGIRIAKGVAVHFSPANVEALFAYSWSLSVLSGCPTVVRLSSKHSGLSREIIGVIAEVAAELNFDPTWSFLSYNHDNEELTEGLTSAADVLIIWGGDETVSNIRKSPCKPHSTVVPFADRESVMVIDAHQFLELSAREKNSLADRARRDILTFDQAACSSPRRLVWIGPGDLTTQAADDFEAHFNQASKQMLQDDDGRAIARLTFAFEAAAVSCGNIVVKNTSDTLFLRVESHPPTPSKHPGLGVVYVGSASSLDLLHHHLRETDQTVVSFGISRQIWEEWIRRSPGPKPRSVAQIGEALTFDSNWDGLNILNELTRLVAFKN